MRKFETGASAQVRENLRKMRKFETGATRDTAEGKPDYAGYLSPIVLKRFGLYMLRHQKQADGTMRASDNWQKGMPLNVYMSSMFRHFMDVWVADRKLDLAVDKEEALCALLFNVMGYLHELLKVVREDKTPYEENTGRDTQEEKGEKILHLGAMPAGTKISYDMLRELGKAQGIIIPDGDPFIVTVDVKDNFVDWLAKKEKEENTGDGHPHSEWYGLKPEERS